MMMATIESLNVSITKMPLAEATSLVLRSRKNRRTPKEKPKRVVIKIDGMTKAKKKTGTAISNLTKDQAAALLKMLMNGG